MGVRKALAAVSAAALLALAGCSPVLEEEHVELSFADGFSPTHPIGKYAVQPFLDELEKNGPAVNLSVKYFPSGSLGDPKDMLDLMRSGAIDMGQLVPSNQSTQLPLSSVGDLPGVSDDHCASVEAMSDLMSENGILFKDELARLKVRPVFLASIPNYEIVTRDKKLEVPKDLRGLVLRSGGGAGDRLVQNLGAAAVSLPGPDLYEGIQRGTVDGALFPPLSVTQYSLQEVLKYSTDGLDIMSVISGFGISQKAWDEMNDAQRKVVTDAGLKAQEISCQGLKQADEKAMKDIAAGGTELVKISAADRKKWVDASLPGQQEWVDELEDRGLPAEQVLSDFRAALAKHETNGEAP